MPITSQTIQCDHCGTPFHPKAQERFCCHGCAYVYDLLHEVGFTRFYELKGNTSTPPIGTRAFRAVDVPWLKTAIQTAEDQATTPVVTAKLGLRGVSCVGCVWLIEAIFTAQAGAVSININARTGIIQPRWECGEFDAVHFAQELQRMGYEVVPPTDESASSSVARELAHRVGICGFFLLNTMLFTLPGYLGMEEDFFLAPLFKLLSALFATLSLIMGGSYFFQRTAEALRHKLLSIDLPIALGLSAAYLGSLIGWLTASTDLIYFDFVATFVFLMLAGRWLQEFALEKNRQHLSRRQPEQQTVTNFGGPNDGERKPVDQIKSGEAYTLAPGEANPVSARLHSDASVSLEWINGEPDPVTITRGKLAPAGAINVNLTSISLTAEEAWSDSLLAQLLEPPKDNFHARRLQRVLSIYLILVLAIAGFGGAAWLILGNQAITALQVFISVLIVSCPCALGVALPLTDELCQSILRRYGLFIKNNDVWERLSQVKTVVFDKTGTLTLETPRLINPECLNMLSEDAMLALYRLVERNLHPVARTLREYLLLRLRTFSDLHDECRIHQSIGNGVYFTDEHGACWSLGKSSWTPCGNETEIDQTTATELRCNGICLATFQFEEEVRDEAKNAIQWLQATNYQIAILSGDAQQNVDRIAAQLNIDSPQSHAHCTPGQKAEWIDHHAPNSALMIGDGANDRLAFDRAICRGTPIVDRSLLEGSTDFFFFGRSLRCLPRLLQLANQRRQTIQIIFALAIAYNFAAITLCLAGAMHPLLAAILMPLSSIATLVVPWRLMHADSA
ncbi:heavy metal translocating P-type ATPase metal-binding domain-containing protein [Cerasicoccus arenae]|uniref:Copper-translocating P-type ATPase n=1 Tax=Cerasicoccus arenae TaxID=424488 RepID=A0A8J3DI68_9BACT|nr:heavy metal translocating P-type ATPase metal-binding domain-containing protein [Cerasicoccus arenae]MBK1857640.1 heavy metal translocating P-type ATPase metal-binding domain-containing protein [Cerasicoccus arenae]GHC05392.1 copper-translocating P-type ATPase [Cerasicoccus arenae]